jgi:putative (di)nucleoside polyphosphate hydrolase
MNADRKVLVGLRAHANGDRAWQLPQGGIEGRERPMAAAYREMQEETGLTKDDVTLITERRKWTVYLIPGEWTRGRRFAGQTQKWFLFSYKGEGLPDLTQASDHEFEALDWVDPTWLKEHVIAFRKKVYEEVFSGFSEYFGEMYAENTPQGVK